MREIIQKRPLRLLLLIFLLLSCNSANEDRRLLTQVRSLMELSPDSALYLLNSVIDPGALNSSLQAEYALLLTQAHDKNYIPHTSDSLILIAVNHYKNKKNELRKAQSYFYLGCVNWDMGNPVAAIDAFLQAEQAMPKDSEERLMGMICINLTLLYEDQGLYSKAMETAHKAYSICEYRNDSSDMIFPLESIAKLFLYQNLPDSALFYYAKALDIATSLADTEWMSSLADGISRTYCVKMDYLEARRYISRAINYRYGSEIPLSYYFLKGDILNKLGQRDSARYYLEQSKNSEDIYTKASSFWALFLLEKESGNLKAALNYNILYQELNDSISLLRSNTEVSKLLNEHAVAMRVKDFTLKQQQRDSYIIYVFLFLFALTILVFMIVDKRKKKRIISLQEELMSNREIALMINQQSTKEFEYQNMLLCIELFRTTEVYKTINTMDKLYNKEIKLSRQERENLRKTIYDIFADVIVPLRELYNLTTDDVYCCILYSLGFSNSTVAACMGVAYGAIKTRKSRIKDKSSDEFFSSLFPRKPLE